MDNFSCPCKMNGTDYIMKICDTAGQEGFENLRKLTYPGTNVFLVCFSIGNFDSYRNVQEQV